MWGANWCTRLFVRLPIFSPRRWLMMNLCRSLARCTEGENWAIVYRTTSLAIPALVPMLVLAPSALAQDAVEGEGDVLTAERDGMVVAHGDLEQIAGKPY